MSDKEFVVNGSEISELSFELKSVELIESKFRLVKIPVGVDGHELKEVFERFASGTVEYFSNYNGISLLAKYKWFFASTGCDDYASTFNEYVDENMFELIGANFTILDVDDDEINEITDLTLQKDAMGFEDCTMNVIDLIKSVEIFK